MLLIVPVWCNYDCDRYCNRCSVTFRLKNIFVRYLYKKSFAQSTKQYVAYTYVIAHSAKMISRMNFKRCTNFLQKHRRRKVEDTQVKIQSSLRVWTISSDWNILLLLYEPVCLLIYAYIRRDLGVLCIHRWRVLSVQYIFVNLSETKLLSISTPHSQPERLYHRRLRGPII